METKPDEIKWGTAKTPACSTAFAVNPVAAYDYMAVLSHTLRRSEVEPLPAYVCGFDSEKWNGTETPWDATMDCPAAPVSPGPIDIKWNIVWEPHFDDTNPAADSDFIAGKVASTFVTRCTLPAGVRPWPPSLSWSPLWARS
jgi:hypothetical protein